jgi:hypothetical protein
MRKTQEVERSWFAGTAIASIVFRIAAKNGLGRRSILVT